MPSSRLSETIDRFQAEILSEWLGFLNETLGSRRDVLTNTEVQSDARALLNAVREATLVGKPLTDISGPEWSKARDVLGEFSRRRAQQGFTPTESAMFVYSLKQPVFDRLNIQLADDPKALAQETWNASTLFDKLGLYTTEVFQKSREEVITRQQVELLELSTPVVELWRGILAVPLIGTLDSSRTQVVMQNLLEAIVAKSASIAIIDITGVPTVDTLVAQHLLKTVAAAKLMGAECVISGIRPQIAQTIIHLGVDLGNVATKATLADAFHVSLKKLGLAVTKS